MPPVKRKTFNKLRHGTLPERLGFGVTHELWVDGGTRQMKKRLIYTITLFDRESLRREAENTRTVDDSIILFVDGGIMRRLPDGSVSFEGRPERVLNEEVITPPENLPQQRELTISMGKKIAGSRISVRGKL
ncbi:MAG TPA: hypothetical protein VM077_05020 [Candidatus Limnocylindrales bacterium]|nr:hypothetical protein [Candidatus Limnocylindrales bacterium]